MLLLGSVSSPMLLKEFHGWIRFVSHFSFCFLPLSTLPLTPHWLNMKRHKEKEFSRDMDNFAIWKIKANLLIHVIHKWTLWYINGFSMLQNEPIVLSIQLFFSFCFLPDKQRGKWSLPIFGLFPKNDWLCPQNLLHI